MMFEEAAKIEMNRSARRDLLDVPWGRSFVCAAVAAA